MSEVSVAAATKPLVILHDVITKHIDAYRHIFQAMDVELLATDNADTLATIVSEKAPVVILIDAAVTQPDAFQVINSLKAEKKTAHIPVVLVTSGFSDKRIKLYPEIAASIEVLPKPFEIEQFFTLMRFFLQQYRYRCVIEALGGKQTNSLIENDKEGIIALDGDGKICFVNYAAERLLRGRASFLVGKFIESMLDEPAPALVSHWQEHPINTVTRSEQILQVDSATLWRVDGESTRVKFAAIPMRDKGEIKHIFAFRELKDTRESKEKLNQLSHNDIITGLPTRVRLEETLDKILRKSKQRSQFCAVLYLDLDHFRYLNESVGHELGDQMMVQVANRIKQLIRREDALARMEGDEFVVVLSYIERPENAGIVARKLVERLHEPYLLEGHEIYSSCSVGVAVYPQCGDAVAALLKNAEAATQRAKSLGRNTYQYFTAEMNKALAERVQIEFELHKAFEKKQFAVDIQPIVDVATGKVQALSASVNWLHPARGLLEMSEFKGIAEDAGLGADLCRWLWREALAEIRMRQSAGLLSDQVLILLPATPVLLSQEDAASWIINSIKDVGCEPGRIVIELPEAAAMVRERETMDAVLALKRHGFQFALDEFGTGFAPLHMLRKIPFSFVKLSDKIVQGIAQSPTDEAIVDGILYLARQLGLQVIAPGLTEPMQGQFLQQRDCQWMGGLLVQERLNQQDYVERGWEFLQGGHVNDN